MTSLDSQTKWTIHFKGETVRIEIYEFFGMVAQFVSMKIAVVQRTITHTLRSGTVWI